MKENKRIIKLNPKNLSLVKGGGAFTQDFQSVYQSWNATSQSTTGFSYTNGCNSVTGSKCLAITKTSTGVLKAGWDFGKGFPTRAWADTYTGGSADFKSAFLILYGANNWQNWGSTNTF